MRLEWKELPAARTAEPYLREVERLLAQDRLPEGMGDYVRLPIDAQLAIGYLCCLMEADWYDRCLRPTYNRHATGALRDVPEAHLPVRFLGWGGWHNDIGPAYGIEGACLQGASSRVFFACSDLTGHAEGAAMLARRIELESSGISDVRAERLSPRTMEEDLEGPVWCVTARLDAGARREIPVNGRPMMPGDTDAILIVPWVGEYDCLIGEVVDGDADNAFVLARHAFCMK